MSRVTSKLQVTLPKAIATQFGIHAGSEVTFEPAGNVILLRPGATSGEALTLEQKLAIFDAGSARARAISPSGPEAADRGWTREELYDRPLAR